MESRAGAAGPAAASFHFHRATPPGEGGVAVLEVHGGGALDALRDAFRPRGGALPGPGEARLGDLVSRGGAPVDEALLALVPAAGAWCGLETWTLSVHGGLWVQEAAAAALRDRGGLELDMAGVLALAIGAGALDAVQAAAYELLVEARTGKAARFFARQHAGELSTALREALAAADAGDAEGTLRAIDDAVAGSPAALRLGTPLRVLIAGRPNAGKSTLFNRLAGDERAVVTPLAGTTRDSLEEAIAIDGFPVIVADSAGLRDPGEAGDVERLGIERVLARRDDAVIYLLAPPWRRSAADDAFIARIPAGRILLAATFADLEGVAAVPADIRISALRGDGLDLLRSEVRRRWIDGLAGGPEGGADDVPCAAFTEEQVSMLRGAALRAREGTGDRAVATLRDGLLQCLASSWPLKREGSGGP